MSEKNSFFKEVDIKVFMLVDRYKASNIYAQIVEQISNFSEVQKKFLGQVTNLLIIFLPLFFVSYIAIGNINKQSDIDAKKEIVSTIENFIYNKAQLVEWGNKIVSPVSFRSKDELEKRLTRAITFSTKTDKPYLKIQDFDQEQLGESYNKSTALVEFANLSSPLLTKLLEEIVTITKSRVTSINFEKDPENSFIRGSLELVHYGKK